MGNGAEGLTLLRLGGDRHQSRIVSQNEVGLGKLSSHRPNHRKNRTVWPKFKGRMVRQNLRATAISCFSGMIQAPVRMSSLWCSVRDIQRFSLFYDVIVTPFRKLTSQIISYSVTIQLWRNRNPKDKRLWKNQVPKFYAMTLNNCQNFNLCHVK